MIDFPASPADGQLFTASNGVVYKYSAAYTAWLAQIAAQNTAVGDFFVTGTGALTAGAPLVPTANIVGNAGGYYNATTGRWTPPAGRYHLFAYLSMAAPSGGNVSASLAFSKNGVGIPNGSTGNFQLTANAGFSNVLELNVDANGTDYFQVFGAANQGGTGYTVGFGAIPLTGLAGVQGPPGIIPPNALSLYQEVVAVSNTSQMQVAWPSTARKVEIEYFVNNLANAPDTVVFRAALNGTPNVANAYATQFVYGTGTTPAAGLLSPATYWTGLGGMVTSKGTLKPVVNAVQATIEKVEVGNSATAGYAMTTYAWGTPGANMNGIQMFNLTGVLMLPGSFLRVYIVP